MSGRLIVAIVATLLYELALIAVVLDDETSFREDYINSV